MAIVEIIAAVVIASVTLRFYEVEVGGSRLGDIILVALGLLFLAALVGVL